MFHNNPSSDENDYLTFTTNKSNLKVKVTSNHDLLPMKAHSDADLHLQFRKDPTTDFPNAAGPAVNKGLPKTLPNQSVIFAGAKRNKTKTKKSEIHREGSIISRKTLTLHACMKIQCRNASQSIGKNAEVMAELKAPVPLTGRFTRFLAVTVQCCFTSTETARTLRDWKPR